MNITLSYIKALSCGIFVTFFVQGCQNNKMPEGPRRREPRYEWGFVNESKDELYGMAITWIGYGRPLSAGAGCLLPSPRGEGSGKMDTEGWDPIPESVTVHWYLRYGKPQEQDVKIASLIPDISHFSGTIWLIFDGTSWRIKAKKADIYGSQYIAT